MFCRYLLEPMMDFKRTVGISSSDSLLGGSGGIESEWTETVWFHLLELGHVGIIPVTKSLMIHHVVMYIYIYMSIVRMQFAVFLSGWFAGVKNLRL